jgi:hypothetical protein
MTAASDRCDKRKCPVQLQLIERPDSDDQVFGCNKTVPAIKRIQASKSLIQTFLTGLVMAPSENLELNAMSQFSRGRR